MPHVSIRHASSGGSHAAAFMDNYPAISILPAIRKRGFAQEWSTFWLHRSKEKQTARCGR
jgi:hypothetical protein